jgi:lysozyme family protein
VVLLEHLVNVRLDGANYRTFPEGEMARTKVFVSYNHKDARWLKRFQEHMALLERLDLVDLWADTRIAGGSEWEREIESALTNAKVAVLLVGPAFLFSKFIWEKEMPRIEAHCREGMEALPVIIRPCAWQLETFLAKLMARPRDGEALSLMKDGEIDLELSNVVYELAIKVGKIPAAVSPASELESRPARKGDQSGKGNGGVGTGPGSTGADHFPDCVALTLGWEGENDDDPRDPSGRTSRGITQGEWDLWRQSHPGLPSDVWQAPQEQILAIYRQNYWNATACGQLPAGVDYCVFDYGVNSGIGHASRVLQSLVGTAVDGEIGPQTIAATAQTDAATLARTICDQRLAFLKSMQGAWPIFGSGWTKRVEGVRKQATAMIGGVSVGPSSSAADPPWLIKARTFQGFAWASGAPPQQIETWLNLVKWNSPNIQGLAQYCDDLAAGGYWPWSGAFVAAMLAEAGLPPVFSGPNDIDRFAWAPAWDSYGTKVDIENGELPQPGDIMRFAWHSAGEHVTFYDHLVDSDDLYHCCGGNQGSAHVVSIEAMPMNCIVTVRRASIPLRPEIHGASVDPGFPEVREQLEIKRAWNCSAACLWAG